MWNIKDSGPLKPHLTSVFQLHYELNILTIFLTTDEVPSSKMLNNLS